MNLQILFVSLLATLLEVSGRGFDPSDGAMPLGEELSSLHSILVCVPFYLVFLLIAYLILAKRDNVKNYTGVHWYYIDSDDNIWYKSLIIIMWVAGVVLILPTVVLGVDVIWRVATGGIFGVLTWILSWCLSFALLLLFVGGAPFAAYIGLRHVSKVLCAIVCAALALVSIYVMLTHLDEILDWKFMFPPFEFHL